MGNNAPCKIPDKTNDLCAGRLIQLNTVFRPGDPYIISTDHRLPINYFRPRFSDGHTVSAFSAHRLPTGNSGGYHGHQHHVTGA